VLLGSFLSFISYAKPASQLARIKDVATIEGIRDNQLV
jgi:flagellar basal body P-ring protein FlgI